MSSLKKIVCFGAALLIFWMLLSPEVSSQPPFPQRPQMERMERLQQFKKLRLMEVLRLSEEESIRFFTRYNKFEEELQGLERERNAIIDHLEEALKQGDKGEVIQSRTDAFAKGFDQLQLLGQKVGDARLQFYNDVRKMLRAEQVAQLIVFERNFNRDLREIIQDVQRERRREMRPR